MKTLKYLIITAGLCIAVILWGIYSGYAEAGYGSAVVFLGLGCLKYILHTKKAKERKMRESMFSEHYRAVHNSNRR